MTTRALIVMPVAEQRGGSEVQLQQLVEQRQLAELDLTIAFLRPGPMADWCRAHGAATAIIDAGRLRHGRRLGRAVRTLARLVSSSGCDVVIGWMAKGQVYAGMSAALAGLPSVWLQPGLPVGPAPLDRLATLLPAKLVITVSQTVNDAQRRLWPPRPTTVIYPAVDLERFNPDRIGDPRAVRDRLGLPLDVPLYGAVGRLDRWKGFHHLIDAVPEVVRAHPEATLVLVGGPHELDPAYAEELGAQARRLNLNGQVRLVGQQPNPEEWMQAMDVVVHTSDAEPFGMVVIEAMALGKPVVAGAAGGPSEIITPGADGYLSPFGERQALASNIARLLGDGSLRSRTGRAARRRAQDFAVQRFAQRFGAAVAGVVDLSERLAR
jgi:glycosyltransferase involved in cell wall biosynthesis